MKILIPIDVWQGNESLAQDLSKILPLEHAELILAYSIQSEPHVEKIADSSSLDSLYIELEKKAKSSLEDFAKQLKPVCKSVETCFEHGSPASVIESIAKRKNADLIIIRGSAIGLLESTFLGHTVSLVVKHSPCSILVLRPGAIVAPLGKVIVGLDGSQLAREALQKFCETYKAWSKRIEIVLTHVVSIPAPWRYIAPIEFIASLEDNLDMSAKAVLAEGETIIAEHGWELNTKQDSMVVRSGDPAYELDRLASEVNAGLIVISAQGKTAVQHFLLGSVSEALALKSSFPALIFK
jgi:nucleotide-binding universal stress UspA family protein